MAAVPDGITPETPKADTDTTDQRRDIISIIHEDMGGGDSSRRLERGIANKLPKKGDLSK
jgi:hypothetical protein